MKRVKAPSPAFVVALIALFLALGGTSYAAISLPKNSVGTLQLKNGAVTSKKVAPKLIVYGAKAAVVAVAAIEANHAKTADTATRANLASSADTAASANNAFTVGGFAPSGLTRISGTLHTTNISNTDGEATIATISLTAPSAGWVAVNADVDIENAPSTVPLVKVRVTQPGSGYSSWWHPAFLGSDPTSCTGCYSGSAGASEVFAVAAGAQTFEIHALVVGTGGVLANTDANAIFTPFGPTGAPPALSHH